MKTLILALTVLLGGSALAQQPTTNNRKTAEERATASAQKIATKLGLDDAQRMRIHDINLGIAQKNDAIRDNTSLTGEQRTTQLEETRNALNAQYREVLTSEQYAKYEAWEKEKRDKMESKRNEKQNTRGNPNNPPLDDDEL